ncbi:MAG: hypothetical protein KDB22_25235, partial [Planctomycetales bacterium]|nr:hypothetical protein [Planctomycetales bacterium]
LMERRLNSWMRAPRESDGNPSERIRKIVERVSPGPYLQVFGSKKASGWTVYSPESESSVAEQGGSSE